MTELSLHEQLLAVFMGRGHSPDENAAYNEILSLREKIAILEAHIKKLAVLKAPAAPVVKKPAATKIPTAKVAKPKK